MSEVQKKFDNLLDVFKRSTAQSMEAARELANISIQQFAEHGDLSYAQTFLEAMPANYIRRVAYLKWLSAHAPVQMDKEGKLYKDKSEDAVEMKVETALTVSFWEYAPDPEQINFGSDTVIEAIEKTIKRFRGTRYHAASDKATTTLNLATEMVGELAEAAKTDNTEEDEQEEIPDDEDTEETEDETDVEDDDGTEDVGMVEDGDQEPEGEQPAA